MNDSPIQQGSFDSVFAILNLYYGFISKSFMHLYRFRLLRLSNQVANLSVLVGSGDGPVGNRIPQKLWHHRLALECICIIAMRFLHKVLLDTDH